MLSDSDSDAGGECQFTINEHYAKAFQYKKEREELAKLKEKYGSDADENDLEDDEESDSESDESEDEDGEELTPAVDAAILRTLAKIKRRDPDIYQSGKDIFQEEQKKTESSSIKTFKSAPSQKSKPITIRQAALSSALEATSRSPSPAPEPLTHVEEQQALREQTIAAFHANDEEEDEDDLLIPREKTKDEIEREEEEYHEFLKSQVGDQLHQLVTIDADDVDLDEGNDEVNGNTDKKEKKKNKKKAKSKQGKEVDDHEFLMNYILNRGWIDRSAKRIPTYGEVTGRQNSKSKGKAKEAADDAASSSSDDDEDGADVQVEDLDDLEKDNEFEEIVDHFESSYNFRFEEPDAAEIKSYPRNLTSTVRREETTRKDARQRKKERKEAELTKKREEVKRMKALKMKEINAKLEKIRKEGGKVDDDLLQELDLEADWDPDAHNRQMAGLYGAEDDEDDEKPTWDDDISIGDVEELDDDAQFVPSQSAPSQSKKKKKKKKDQGGGMDQGVDMDEMDADAEYVPADDDEWDGTEEMRKKKLDEYMEELYAMDFNDMVGDMPTRFKYTSVAPTNYSLTPAEILMATDAELNEYVGVKKFAPYRKDRTWDSQRVEKLKELKRKLVERTGGMVGERNARDGATGPPKKRMGKKERLKLRAVQGITDEGGDNGVEDIVMGEGEDDSSKKRKRAEESNGVGDGADIGHDGSSGKRKRRRRRKDNGTVVE